MARSLSIAGAVAGDRCPCSDWSCPRAVLLQLPTTWRGSRPATTLTGPSAEAEALWERAHREAADDGNVSRAVRCGFWLSFLLLNRGEVPRGSGWVDRSQRMLDESRLDCVERGYIRYAAALRAVLSGDPESAHTGFLDAAAIGTEYRSTELTTLAASRRRAVPDLLG